MAYKTGDIEYTVYFSLMQMVSFAGLTLFDQKNVICNTPCFNIIVNTTYYDIMHFAKLVNQFELEGTWSLPPTQGYDN